ncbi:phosphoenolpyruvate-dependent phosphotransferase system [bacterium MnTg02]|nr:phosphoenolpyruvate-dependent phosphotransferase system [bacterium MnTg02]
MAASIGAPRVLLRRLREIMARPESPQDRLDKIVVQIAANMVAEVSSIYLRRQDNSLELFATEGLNPDAVHNTHLARGEGLVGLIAERAQPLNLADAQTHPSFSYRPETGEDPYHSFVGVPILRGGQTLGVLTVQNRVRRHYSEEEIEALQTTAMVIAELIASGEIDGAGGVAQVLQPARSVKIDGQVLSEGIALGHVVLHEPRVVPTALIAEDVGVEIARMKSAMDELTNRIDTMLSRRDMARAGEHRDVLEAYRMFAQDRGWRRRLTEAVSTGLTAEAAVQRVQTDLRARMLRQRDPYMRERLHDLDDLSYRLLRVLAGASDTAAVESIPADAILVARNMGPAELLDYDSTRLRGLVLEEGSASSHVAIVARALDIAALGMVEGCVDQVDPGDEAVIDAETGEFHCRPSQEVVDAYSDKVRFRAKRQQQFARLKDRPAVTTDGAKIDLLMNAGLLVDLPHLDESGAEGIGLFRTELQFMIASAFPRLNQQMKTYKAILDGAGGRPVIFRSLDIGGDKVLPYLRHDHEENPALGWRALRISLDRPGLFRTQIRALLRASVDRELRLMLPMVVDISEFDAAKALIEKERAFLKVHGYAEPKAVMVGAMIEVPSILWQLDQFLPHVDFVSVGSNDLLQFMFAADRSNIRVADRYDPLSCAVFRALKQVVVAANRYNVPLTLCGEMAGKPLEAMALIGLGFRAISMAPASIGPVKEMILTLDAGHLEREVSSALESKETSLRPMLSAYAARNGIAVGG